MKEKARARRIAIFWLIAMSCLYMVLLGVSCLLMKSPDLFSDYLYKLELCTTKEGAKTFLRMLGLLYLIFVPTYFFYLSFGTDLFEFRVWPLIIGIILIIVGGYYFITECVQTWDILEIEAFELYGALPFPISYITGIVGFVIMYLYVKTKKKTYGQTILFFGTFLHTFLLPLSFFAFLILCAYICFNFFGKVMNIFNCDTNGKDIDGPYVSDKEYDCHVMEGGWEVGLRQTDVRYNDEGHKEISYEDDTGHTWTSTDDGRTVSKDD